jgi:hypothetical protein
VTPPLPKDRVLSTLNQDGTRNWIRPRLAPGRFLRRRRIENETDQPRRYAISLAGTPDAVLKSPLAVWDIAPHPARTIPLFVEVVAATFQRGQRRVAGLPERAP